MKRTLIAAATLALLVGPALAQQPAPKHEHGQHGPMAHGPMAHGPMAGGPYMPAMRQMHQAMMTADDADADRAFALKMIEHHRGGIAMVQALAQHGDDAELKKMAEKTRAEQEKEIAELQSWLDRHGGRTPQR